MDGHRVVTSKKGRPPPPFPSCPHDFYVRPAGADSLDVLHELDVKIFRGNAWSVADYASGLTLPTRATFLGLNRGRAVAFAVFDVVSPEAELIKIGIHPDHQGEGWGRHFLLEAETALHKKLARQDRSGRLALIFLEVSTRNAVAKKLYRGAHYRETGRRRRYCKDGSDALVMKKQLGWDDRKTLRG